MEALTILLIGITSTLGFIAFGMGTFVFGTARRYQGECQRELTLSNRPRGPIMRDPKLVTRDHTRTSFRFLCALAVAMFLGMAPLGVSPARADVDDYIKPHFDPNRNEVGFRVGFPILAWEIQQQTVPPLKKTEYNEIEIHSFRLKAIATDNLNIGLSLRWKQFESNLFGGRYKRAETNCDATILVELFVASDHQIASIDPPLISGVNCTTSGFGFEQILDYMMQAMTFVLSGGEDSIGFFDIVVGLGTLLHNAVALFSGIQIDLSDPIQGQIISDKLLPFVQNIHALDERENEVFLSEIRYDPKGIWVVFSYPQWLEDVVQRLAEAAGLALTKSDQPNMDSLPPSVESDQFQPDFVPILSALFGLLL